MWLLASVAAAIPPRAAHAVIETWNGAGADPNWTTAGNWVSNVAPVAGDSLVFDGFAQPFNTNTLPSGTSIGSITFAATAGAFTLGGNAITLAGSAPVIVDDSTAGNQTIGFPIIMSGAGTVAVTAGGSSTPAGNLTLAGAISGAGGLTLVNDHLSQYQSTTSAFSYGSLTLSAQNVYTGATAVQTGQLVLNFAPLGLQPGAVINGSTSLVLGSTAPATTPAQSALAVLGSPVRPSVQSFNTTTLGAGLAVISAQSSFTTTLTLGTSTRNTGGTVAFSLPADGAISVTRPLSNGILGGWATVGSDWATLDNASPPNVIPYTGYTDLPGTFTNLTNPAVPSTANVRWGTNPSTTGNSSFGTSASSVTDINTFVFSDTTFRDITINGTLRLGAQGGIMVNSTANGSLSLVGGTLTAGGAANTPGELTISSVTLGNRLTINSQIQDNGAAVTLVKTGPGNATLMANNTYSGGTFINQGTLIVTDDLSNSTGGPGTLGTGPVYIQPGAQLTLDHRPISNNIFISGSGVATSGAPDYGGALVLFAFSLYGSETYTSTITLAGDARIVASCNAGNYVHGKITGPHNVDLGSITQFITPVTPGMILENTTNDWTGNTRISGLISTDTSEVIPNGVGKGNVTLDCSQTTQTVTLTLGLSTNSVSETLNGLSSTGDPSRCIITTQSSASLTVGDNNASGSYAGSIQGSISLIKTGTGTQTLSGANTYSGGTSVNQGTLVLGPSGLPKSVIISVAAGATLDATASGLTIASNKTLNVDGTVLGAVTSAGTVYGHGSIGPLTVTAGSLTPIGTLTSPSLSMSGGAWTVNLSGATSDRLQVTGAANFTGGSLAINILSAPTLSSYTILTAGSISGAPTLGANKFGRITFAIDAPALSQNKLQLDMVTGPATLIWDNTGATGDGVTWNTQGQQNWRNTGASGAAGPDVFYPYDDVVFNDSNAGHYTVTFTGSVAPRSITVDSAGNYTFNGNGSVAGPPNLTKSGAGTLNLSGMANPRFSMITLNGGTLILPTPVHLPTAVTQLVINGGSLSGSGTLDADQTWAGDFTFLGPVKLTSYSGNTLTITGNPKVTIQPGATLEADATVINGAGASLTKAGAGTLILSVNAGTLSNGVTVSNGTLALFSNINSQVAVAIPATVNAGCTLVLRGISDTSDITLQGGTLGSATNGWGIAGAMKGTLTAADGTTSMLLGAHPLSQSSSAFLNLTGPLAGGGTLQVSSGTNVTDPLHAEGAVYFTTTAASTYSGSILLGHNTLVGLISYAASGSYSPVGGATLILTAGDALRNGSTAAATTTGGYSVLNIQNAGSGSITLGNNIQIAGTGLVVINELDATNVGNTITMGALSIGGGQELAIYRDAPNARTVAFPSVTLTGGNATFSPKPPGFGPTITYGANLSLANVTETAPSGIVMSGLFALTLSGTVNYSGDTVVNSGTLNLGGTQTHGPASSLVLNGGVTNLQSNPGSDAAYNLAAVVTPATGSSATLNITSSSTDLVQLRGLSINAPGSGGAGLVVINAATSGTGSPTTGFGAAGGSVRVFIGDGAGHPGPAPRATVEAIWSSIALDGYWALRNGLVSAVARGITLANGVVTNPGMNGLVILPSVDPMNRPATYLGEDINGDTNGDGKVDVNDVGNVLAHLNTIPGSIAGETGFTLYTPAEGDVNGDLTTDVNDLTVVLANLNQTYSPAAESAGAGGVPEPGSLCLITLGAHGLLRRRRRSATA